MGDTKDLPLSRGLRLARFLVAALTGVFFIAALAQVLFFQEIKLSFQTGIDAQQIAAMTIKKGTAVELPTPLKPGSYFQGWSLSSNSAEIITDSTGLMRSTTLYAVWDGAEKYAVLSVNGVEYKEINIFETRVDGIDDTRLNQEWRVLDDFAKDNPNLVDYDGYPVAANYTGKTIDPNNNFSRFLGWRYRNANNSYNDLLYTVNASGTAGTWTWVQRNGNTVISETVISATNRFYPPNYRTTFTALLDYRPVTLELYDRFDPATGAGRTRYNTVKLELGADNVALPLYTKNQAGQFSHWEIDVGNLKNYAQSSEELLNLVNKLKTRYEAGEVLVTVDPLLYYLGNELLSPDGKSEPEVHIRLRAVYWQDSNDSWEESNNNTVYHFTGQTFTDLDSGTTYKNFGTVGRNDLSVKTPLAYDEEGECIWLCYDSQIFSYSFYDHRGVYHLFTAARFPDGKPIGIGIGDYVPVLDEEVYFNPNFGITIAVNYQSAAVDISVSFNYGEGLYELPDYTYKAENVYRFPARIGDTFEILSGEKYMRYNYIFTGWQIVGDETGRLYTAGEKFKIDNFNTQLQSTSIEFVAVWHLQRLLFNFNFHGGNWENNEEPDFTLMKGAYDTVVKIVNATPVRFGYDFAGWTVDDDDTQIWWPGDEIRVGTYYKTLHAQWTPRRLSVIFYVKNDAIGTWSPRPAVEIDVNGSTLKGGGTVELLAIRDNEYYTFEGWQIGDNVIGKNITQYPLTTQVLSSLETVNRNGYLEVHIYAVQTKCTVKLRFDFIVDGVDVGVNVDQSDFLVDARGAYLELPQGELFYDYYPFKVRQDDGTYAIFDTDGRRFEDWVYVLNGRDEIINGSSRIPAGIEEIQVYPTISRLKTITVRYYDHKSNLVLDEKTEYNFGSPITLLHENLPIDTEVPGWGTFVGWALSPDNQSGNPDVIFDVYYKNFNHEIPVLRISNHNDTVSDEYAINIDRYAECQSDLDYILKLYAVYANDYAVMTYYELSNGASMELRLPLYSNTDYTKTSLGGRTVGYDAENPDDYVNHGVSVLDDNGLLMWQGTNFVGWQVNPDSLVGVDSATQDYLLNKIWFPGEFLPSLDFNIAFDAIRVNHNTEPQPVKVGNRTYRVLSLSSATAKYTYTGNVDVVALPRGNYTVAAENIVINSTSDDVHVVVPSEGIIVLQPRAIQCNTIREFYVGDNLTISGSPVVGANFQAYRVKKGYRLTGSNATPTGVQDASVKYDFASSFKYGLLVSKNQTTLYGVPSHTALTTNALLTIIQTSITNIQDYALSDINTLTTINLAKASDLTIGANAIYGGAVEKVILPGTDEVDESLVVSAKVLAGALTKLKTVVFGAAETSSAFYAFVDDNCVYYKDNIWSIQKTKTHLMYVFRAVKLNDLDYITNNLTISADVKVIEPCALMGLDWTKINAITAKNAEVDLTQLLGLPDEDERPIPIFTNRNNPSTRNSRMIQSYEKIFRFAYNTTVIDLPFVYGQTFRVFNAESNDYAISYTKDWYQFIGWKFRGKLYKTGEVYRVGIDAEVIGDGDTTLYDIIFDATPNDCWQAYPVQFQIYNNTTGSLTPKVFYDIDGVAYDMNDLIHNPNLLYRIYLPAIDQTFTLNNVTYQFIGWTTDTGIIPTNVNNWNTAKLESRLLPNHTTSAMLNSGSANTATGIYIYNALYEKVTPGMDYKLLSNGTYAVTGMVTSNVTSLNIPFAHYDNGYMVPISTIGENAFGSRSSIDSNTLSEIVIGAAVTEIGADAFNNVLAAKLTFNHRGRDVYHNYTQTSVGQLTIGNNAFANNNALTNLVLPAALKTLGDGVFKSCIQLQKVTFETGYTPYLNSLGNEVFDGDQSMTINAIVEYLVNDTNGIRFTKVGDGIFKDTAVTNPLDERSGRIVWNGTLLHTYYRNGYPTSLNFDEKIKTIGGYAFVNLGSDSEAAIAIDLTFSNPNVIIKAHAFSGLHTSIDTLDLSAIPVSNLDNVDNNAFDASVKHKVYVYTSSYIRWTQKFGTVTKDSGFEFSTN